VSAATCYLWGAGGIERGAMSDVRERVEGWLSEMREQYRSGRSTGLSAHVDAFGTGTLPRTMWLTTGLALWCELCDAVESVPEFEPAFAIEVEGDVALGGDCEEAFVEACRAQLHEFTPPELYVFGREDVDAVATQLAQQGRRVGGLQLGARRHVVMQTTGIARYGSEVETFRVVWVLPLGSALLARLPA
jgi:hypothetical protein